MARRRRTEREADEQDAALRGQSFAEEQYAFAERDQARENERLGQPTADEADPFLTDAEVEALEADSRPKDEEEP